MGRFNGWTSEAMNGKSKTGSKPGKRSKYGNKRVFRHGFWFDSILEADKYGDLLPLKNAGIIDIQLQIDYPLFVDGKLISTYRADFVVTWLKEGHRREVYDAKGCKTREYRIKKKLMLAIHGIEIIELGRSKKQKPK